MKRCTRCKQRRPKSLFGFNPGKSDGLQSHCKDCINGNVKACYKKQRDIILDHYGNKCACCGETRSRFLQIDHVYNDGYAERKKYSHSQGIYSHIIKAGFPDRYQILCSNCNHGKSLNDGVCPHHGEQPKYIVLRADFWLTRLENDLKVGFDKVTEELSAWADSAIQTAEQTKLDEELLAQLHEIEKRARRIVALVKRKAANDNKEDVDVSTG